MQYQLAVSACMKYIRCAIVEHIHFEGFFLIKKIAIWWQCLICKDLHNSIKEFPLKIKSGVFFCTTKIGSHYGTKFWFSYRCAIWLFFIKHICYSNNYNILKHSSATSLIAPLTLKLGSFSVECTTRCRRLFKITLVLILHK